MEGLVEDQINFANFVGGKMLLVFLFIFSCFLYASIEKRSNSADYLRKMTAMTL